MTHIPWVTVWLSHFLLAISFSWAKRDFSLFPSSSVSWQSLFVCWDDVSHTVQQVFRYRRESETKLQSTHSFISSTYLSLTQHWSLKEHFRHVISFAAACLCLGQKCYIQWFGLFAILGDTLDEGRAAMVNDLCSAQFPPLCFTVAETNHTFCPEDLSFDTGTCPWRY